LSKVGSAVLFEIPKVLEHEVESLGDAREIVGHAVGRNESDVVVAALSTRVIAVNPAPAIAILGDRDQTARADADVIGTVEDVFVGRFVEQRELAVLEIDGDVLPDLAAFRVSAIRRAEVDHAAFQVQALEPGSRSRCGDTVSRQTLLRSPSRHVSRG